MPAGHALTQYGPESLPGAASPGGTSVNGTEQKEGIGARVLRKEDARLLRGHGSFVGDIKLPGLRDVAFLRSPLAHARVRAIHKPHELGSFVFVRADLAGVRDVQCNLG